MSAPLKAALCLTLLALGAALPASVRAQQGAATADMAATPAPQVTLAQMQGAAARAIRIGRPDLALRLAQALLARDPRDPFANYILAQALLRSGAASEARAPARLAYRLARTDIQRHEAARIAALVAAAEDRYLPAQVWMRRAIQSAPTPAMKARAVSEFRSARRAARLQLRFGLSVAPSSNVNGGASEEFNVVDGFPFVGLLSPDAQALSGTEAEATLRLRYRLGGDAEARTELHSALQVRRVRLSDEAREKAPMASGSDYGATYWETGLSHSRQIGTAGTTVTAGLFAGRAWFGGDVGYDFARADLGLVQRLGPSLALSLGHSRQDQRSADGAAYDILTTGWRAGLIWQIRDLDRLTLTLSTQDAQSDNTQSDSTRREISLRYALGRPVGPVQMAFGIAASDRHFPDYRVVFPVPGGRSDQRLSADLDLTLHRIDYAGFVPTIRLSAERTTSNVSRFETEDLSISLGFRSAF